MKLVGVLVAVLAFAVPATPAAGCDLLSKLLGRCGATPVGFPAPDPGGAPGVPATLPPAGKAWGVNLGLRDEATDEQRVPGLQALRAMGATHYRLTIGWSAVSPTKADPDGQLDVPPGEATGGVARFDRLLAQLRAAGITPVITTGEAPIWATRHAHCADPLRALLAACPVGWNAHPHPASWHMAAFRRYVAALTRRWPEAVIEGPNEPDHAWVMRYGSRVDAPDMAREQCAVATAVRSVDPQRTVLGPGMYDPAYMQRFFAQPGVMDCLDVASLHSYAHGEVGAGSPHAARLEVVRAAFRKAGRPSRVFLTETGETQRDGQPAEDVLTGWILRIVDQVAQLPDVEGILVHTLRDATIAMHTDRTSPEYHFGLLTEGWTPKGRFCALLARVPGAAYAGCADGRVTSQARASARAEVRHRAALDRARAARTRAFATPRT